MEIFDIESYEKTELDLMHRHDELVREWERANLNIATSSQSEQHKRICALYEIRHKMRSLGIVVPELLGPIAYAVTLARIAMNNEVESN
jgi:hypothetical protein